MNGKFLHNTEVLLNNGIAPNQRDFFSRELDYGLTNYILFLRNSEFRWPAWVQGALGSNSEYPSIVPTPILTNNNMREWQLFNNYLSAESITINRQGMIGLSGNDNGSVEIWFLNSNNEVQELDNKSFNNELNGKTGEIKILYNAPFLKFSISFCGARSSLDEVIVNLELGENIDFKNSKIALVVRPYTNLKLGGIRSIQFIEDEGLVSINSFKQLALPGLPDEIFSGNSLLGDIHFRNKNISTFQKCDSGLATMAFVYNAEQESKNLTFRLSLEPRGNLEKGQVSFKKCREDFSKFYSIRMEEGMTINSPDDEFQKMFERACMRLLATPVEYVSQNKFVDFRNLYFLTYSFNRAGYSIKSEKMLELKLRDLKLIKKKPTFDDAFKGAFLLLTYHDLYVHKRDSVFNEDQFSLIRDIGEYVYKFTSAQHSIDDFKVIAMPESHILSVTGYECFIFQAAMDRMAEISRWRGIFGDEKKCLNEAMRLRAIYSDFIAEKNNLTVGNHRFDALWALPQQTLLNTKTHGDIDSLLDDLFHDFSLCKNKLLGVDLYKNLSLLHQILLINDNNFSVLKTPIFEFFDDFMLTPEFLDPVSQRGCNGEGNSIIVASLLFNVLKHMIFMSNGDSLEIFPFPEKEWFVPGKKFTVKNGSSKFGNISFSFETTEKAIIFYPGESPRFLPSEIKISFPFETEILYSDEFLVKKRIGNSWFINGWPSFIKFPLKKNVFAS